VDRDKKAIITAVSLTQLGSTRDQDVRQVPTKGADCGLVRGANNRSDFVLQKRNRKASLKETSQEDMRSRLPRKVTANVSPRWKRSLCSVSGGPRGQDELSRCSWGVQFDEDGGDQVVGFSRESSR
jgi:hypothetical protein